MFEKIFGKDVGASAQTPEENKLAAYIKEKVEEVRRHGLRVSHEGTWMTNSAYLLGFNSVYYDTASRQFRMLGHGGMPLKRSRMSVNKILPTVNNRVARLCKTPPKYDVRPNSTNVEDKDAARLSMQVLNMIFDKEKINEKRINLYMWLQQCGHSYIKIAYDPLKGKKILNPQTGEMDYEGDICIDVASAFEVFVDPLAKNMDEATWLVQAKVRKLDYFRTHYGEKGNLVKEENAWLLSTQYEMRINTLNTMGPTTSGISMQMKNSAIELAYYEKKSRLHPNGRMIIVANGIILEDKDLPCGEIPFVKFDDIVIAGKFYSESLITHLRPIQDQFNRLISKRAEWVNKLLAGKYIAARGSGLIQEALNDQVGEVLEYDAIPGVPPPTAMNLPVIPQYAYEEEVRLEKMFDDISGINQISKAQLPSAQLPAIGMQLLLEQDETRIGVITEQHENSWARVGQIILMYANEYYKTPRLLKMAGKNQEYQVKEFQAADLKNQYDVIVIRGSSVPGSKVLKRQEIINAFQQGLLGDPADPKVREKVLGMLEYGDVSEVWEDYALDEAQVKRDIEMIEKGGDPQVHELDNHTFHLAMKNRYRKSEKFDQLSPEAKLIFNENMEAHIQIQMRINNPQLAAQEKVNAESQGVKQILMENPEIMEATHDDPTEPMPPAPPGIPPQ